MEQIQLSNIADIVSGYAIPSADMVEEGTPIIKITNIKEDGSLDLENTAKYNKPITSKLQKFILKDKDVVVCMTGATIGKVARILKADQDYIVNQRVCIIRAKDSRLQDFVYHTLTLPTFRKYVEVVGYGAAQPNISAVSIGKYRIQSSNNLPTQQKIASILSTYDTLIENNTKRIRLLEQMAENLYKEWFVRFRFPGHENVEMENGGPRGWNYSILGERYNITIGKTPPRKEFHWFTQNDPFAQNWLSISDMKGLFTGDTSEQLTQEAVKKFNMVVVPPNTILVSFKLTVGRITIATQPLCTNEAIAHIKNVPKEEHEFLYQQLKNYEYDKLGNTSAIGNAINSKIVKGMKIIIPTHGLLMKFHNIAYPFFVQIKSLQEQNALLARQRDLLLPRLMSGKLEVKE